MRYEEIDLSDVPWASLSPEDRKRILQERKRAGSKVRAWFMLVILGFLILPKIAGGLGTGLSLWFGSVYFVYYLRQTKRHGIAFFRDMDWGTVTKRKNPVLFRIEVFSCYALAVTLFIGGVYFIGHS